MKRVVVAYGWMVYITRHDAARVMVQWSGEAAFDAEHPFPVRDIERAASDLLGALVVLDFVEECTYGQGPQSALWRMRASGAVAEVPA